MALRAALSSALRRRLAAGLALLCLCGPGAFAAGEAGAPARAAMEQLRSASAGLVAAGSARDRVAALTRVITAYEAGLAALRDGLRQVAAEETALARAVSARSAEVSRLLGGLGALEAAAGPLLLLHPDGPLDALRSGMLMADLAPGLRQRVALLRADLDEVRVVRALQEAALGQLAEGLGEVQRARTELSLAIQARTRAPAGPGADPEALARLLAAADTLEAFAEGLVAISPRAPEAANPPAPEAVNARASEAAGSGAPEAAAGAGAAAGPGAPLVLPVEGRLLRAFGAADAAGILRPGWVIAAAPEALVTSPVAATLRYLGPLLDYGNVMILEPSADTLLVLAGLGQVYGEAGDVVAAGAPLGLMGGRAADGSGLLAEPPQGGGAAGAADAGLSAGSAGRSETLYLELRKGGRPVDPATWFVRTKDGTE